MDNTIEARTRRNYIVGVCTALVSLLIYIVSSSWSATEDVFFFSFLLNFGLTISYFIFSYRSRKACVPPFLVLALISAYSLNRFIPVFEQSVSWLNIVLIVCCAALLSLRYIGRLSLFVRHMVMVLLGAALCVFLYLSVYLLPVYLFSIVCAIALGFSLHSFVPLLLVIVIIRLSYRLLRSHRQYAWSLGAGVAGVLLFVAGFCMQWTVVNKAVKSEFQHSLMADNTDLPAWIRVARHLPKSLVAEKYLKGGLIYTQPDFNFSSFSWDMPSRNFDEGRKHDPLVFIAALFSTLPPLTTDDRIHILEALYVSAHQTQDRLWSGNDLTTTNVLTNVRLWPQQRIAYTEKTITVRQQAARREWRNDKEAIYTFHLPEGGVVTSLSLWINGKEQKGVLTSKGRADSAYRQVVGVEQHDPSLVRWQEGNTVSVRVFPVLAGQSRVFKIGVTAPLTLSGNKLTYSNMRFEGPDASGAQEIQQVDWVSEPQGLEMPAGFTANRQHRYEREIAYDGWWSLAFTDPGFQPDAFAFGGRRYVVQQYQPSRKEVTTKTVYLDVNAAWTADELASVYDLVKDREVLVYDEALLPLTPAGIKGAVGSRLLQQRFSFFPFHAIASPSTALVISKSNQYSPSLKDIKGSAFGDSLAARLKQGATFRFFNLGADLTPYLRTLKEHRAFSYESGDTRLLRQLLANGTFATSIEDSAHAVADNAGIQLVRTSDAGPASGPDHIMRLFAYNHLMSGLRGNLFPAADEDSLHIQEAEQAYIVTPVSSLVVLETQQDYDRFGIRRGNNTLGDATLHAQGAVPEPQEWLLIITALAAIIWVGYRHRAKRLAGI